MAGVAHRLVLVDVDRGHAGASGAQRSDQRAGRDQAGPARVHQQRGRLHALEVGRGDDAARGVDQAHVQGDDVAFLEERGLAARGQVTVGAGALERRRARPYRDLHSERLAVAGNDAADPAIAEDAEGLAPQRCAHADLPAAGLERGHLLRDLAHRRQHQAPGQFRRRMGRGIEMQARGDDHAVPGAGVDVDVRVDAALADQPEPGQSLDQRRADLRALADQHQDLGVGEALRQRRDVLDVIVPDRDVVSRKLAEAAKRPYRVVIVVQDRDFHGLRLCTEGSSRGFRAALTKISAEAFAVQARSMPRAKMAHPGRARQEMQLHEWLGVSIALVSSALGGTAAAVTRYLVGNSDPLTLAILRWAIGFLCVLPVALVLRVKWPPRSDWPGVAGLGFCFFGLFFVLYNVAMGYTTAARASLALSTLPLQTMVVGALLGVEPLTARKSLGVFAALASGLSAAPSGAWRGELIMTGAVLCMAFYNVWSRPFISRSSALGFLAVGMGVGAAALVVAGLLTDRMAVLRDFGAAQWVAGIYLGIAGGALAFILWVLALERASPTRVANTMTVNPIAAGLLAAELVGEPITLDLIVGLIAVFAGIWIATTEAQKA